ncbi:hypothetical protein OXX80_006502 [Metschnikowia pulcherrima]
MDKISESAFSELPAAEPVSENSSLLTVIVDLSPRAWHAVAPQASLSETMKSLLVFLNAHLALNNSNQVAVVASSPLGSRFLHPSPGGRYEDESGAREAGTGENGVEQDGPDKRSSGAAHLINDGMYRQFRVVDTAVLSELNAEFQRLESRPEQALSDASTLSGALSMALTYTNRMLHLDQSIVTTQASAITATTSAVNSATDTTAHAGPASATAMDARILIVSASDTHDTNYIAVMNAIFAAQKMKVPVDVARLGPHASPYLQQAADATKGVYLHISEPRGLVQTLCTAYFIEASLRSVVILPTNTNVDYKASCFVTGKPVDIGYVCAVCLCIMSIVPDSDRCPTCKSVFSDKLLAKLRRGPVVARKKRKVDDAGVPETANGDS